MNLILYIYCIITLLFISVNSKEISIRNNDNNFKNLNSVLNNNQYDKELKLNFVDSYYNMTFLGYVTDLNVSTNLYFIGNQNGTTFDYCNSKLGVLHIRMNNNNNNNNNKETTIIFKNIIFENFNDRDNLYTQHLRIMDIFQEPKKYIIFENCTFQNNKQDLLSFHAANTKVLDDFYIQFNNCSF